MEVFRTQILADLPKSVSTLFQEEDNVYLVSKLWWDSWLSLPPSIPPGSLDNTPLFTFYSEAEGWKSAVLRPHLQEGIDFLYVPARVWNTLAEKVGGGPRVLVNVIAEMPDWNRITLEIVHPSQTRYVCVSIHLQMSKFKRLLSDEFHLPESRFTVSLKSGDTGYASFSTLEEMGVKDKDQIWLRERRTSFLDVGRVDDDDQEQDDLAAAIKASLQNCSPPQEPESEHSKPQRASTQELAQRIAESLAMDKQLLAVQKLPTTARRLDEILQQWNSRT